MKRLIAGLLFSGAVAFAAVPIGLAKTVKECEAEWKANKAAIQASGHTKKRISWPRAELRRRPLLRLVPPQHRRRVQSLNRLWHRRRRPAFRQAAPRRPTQSSS